MKDINALMNEQSYHELTMLLFGAFESLHNNNDISKLQDLFHNYFTPFHKMYDFFDQLELNFIEKMSIGNLLIFHKIINNMLIQYEYKKYSNDTLLSILRLAIITKATNIENRIIDIWKEIEKDKRKNDIFYLTVFQNISAMTPASFSYKIIDRVLDMNNEIPKSFMPLLLIKKSEENILLIPNLLKRFTQLDWEKSHDEYETKMTILEIVNRTGIFEISKILNELSSSSYWFIEKLNKLKRISFIPKYQGNTIKNYSIYDKVTNEEYEFELNYPLYRKLNQLLDYPLDRNLDQLLDIDNIQNTDFFTQINSLSNDSCINDEYSDNRENVA